MSATTIRTRRILVVLGCALMFLFAVSACTKGAQAGGKPSPSTSKASSSTPASPSSPAASSSAANAGANAGVPVYDVYVKNFQYHGMPKTVPANQPVMVAFTNKESFQIDHEFVVLQLPKGKTAQDVINDAKKKGPKAEDDWIHFADSGDPLPTNSGTLVTMDLPPGNYVATCWQTGKAGGGNGPAHVAIGMIAPFTASTSTQPSSTTQPASYDVYVKNFQYHGMPKTVPANQPVMVAFTNKESFQIDHEFVVLQLPKGKTAQDVINDAKKKGPKAEDDWIHFADSGDPLPINNGTTVKMDLPPGNYVATCWQTGKAGGGNGPAHVAIGMIAPFTAK